MKNIFIKITVIFSLFAFSCAYSEVYSWVDKDGKKHFGEKVPKEYIKQSTELDVKPTNSMDATKVSNRPQQTTNRSYQPQPLNDPYSSQPQTNYGNSCEQQKRAYEQSVACYSSCKNKDSGFNGRHVNNVANCGHCVDVKKPNCH